MYKGRNRYSSLFKKNGYLTCDFVTNRHDLHSTRSLLLNLFEHIGSRDEMIAAHIVIGAAHHGALERTLPALAAHLGGHTLVVDMATLGIPYRVHNRLLAPGI